ncbi:MAG: IclR family transcriptional regulator, partial [Alphaproteobacteria bacterium]
VTAETQKDNLKIGALEKGFRVLDAFTTNQHELGLSEIVEITGLSKSSAQQYTHTLHKLGYLNKNPQSRRYSLSHRVLRPAHAFLSANRLVERATPHVTELRREFKNRTGFGLHDDLEVVYLIALQSNRTVFATAHPGLRIPGYCTAAGHSILAFLPEDIAGDIIARSNRVKRTELTVIDSDKIMDSIREARAQGFAMLKNEFNPNEINLAAPVFDTDGTPIAAITSISKVDDWPEGRLTEELIPALAEAARAISFQDRRTVSE